MRHLLFPFVLLSGVNIYGQATPNKEFSLKELDTPNSPAFQLLDAAPSNINGATTPKEFVLNTVQNLDMDSKWFQNYSAEFAPYWWSNPNKRNVYSFSGLAKDAGGNYIQDYFAGAQFTSISLAFLNKDYIPDASDAKQKIASIGIQIPLIRIFNEGYVDRITDEIKNWHDDVQKELDAWDDEIAKAPKEKKGALIKKFANATPEATEKRSQTISALINEKPLFSLVIAAATSAYGVGDSLWKAGRTGVWGNLGVFVPVSKERPYVNYINVAILGKFGENNFTKRTDTNLVVYSQATDIGLRLGIETNRLTVASELFFRSTDVISKGDYQSKVTGILSYEVANNLYLTGTVGRDFGPSNAIITLLGVNWGFGSERAKIED